MKRSISIILFFLAGGLCSPAIFSEDLVISPEKIAPEDESIPQKLAPPPQSKFNALVDFCIQRNKKFLKKPGFKKTRKKMERVITPESLHECACVAQVLWDVLPEERYNQAVDFYIKRAKRKLSKELKSDFQKLKDLARKRCLYDTRFPESTFFDVQFQ